MKNYVFLSERSVREIQLQSGKEDMLKILVSVTPRPSSTGRVYPNRTTIFVKRIRDWYDSKMLNIVNRSSMRMIMFTKQIPSECSKQRMR